MALDNGRFCDHFIEGDPWAGTYCKLPAGHEGEHSPHYPDGTVPLPTSKNWNRVRGLVYEDER